MMRFWRSGTSAAPISTPRSPRATMTASVSARIASSASTASDFSILAITCACAPAAVISSRRSRTSAAERTNDRATKSTPRSRAKSRSSMSFRVSEGIGTGTPGTLTPLCVSTMPPATTMQRARPRSTLSTRNRTSPSSIRISCPACRTSQTAVGLTGSSSPLATSCAATTTWSPRSSVTGSGSSPIRTFGPWRSAMTAIGRPISASISRTSLVPSACPSCVPWEKLRRAAFIPASASASRVSRDEDTGPIVATIFVRRGISAAMSSAYRETRADFRPMSLRDHWEQHAPDWVRWAREPDHDSYWRYHREPFLELVPPPGRLTLDIGCGEGRLTRDLAPARAPRGRDRRFADGGRGCASSEPGARVHRGRRCEASLRRRGRRPRDRVHVADGHRRHAGRGPRSGASPRARRPISLAPWCIRSTPATSSTASIRRSRS